MGQLPAREVDGVAVQGPGGDDSIRTRVIRVASKLGARARNSNRWRALIVAAGLVTSALVVWHASQASFSGNSSNNDNSWTAGTVSLSDNDSGSMLFNVTNLVPGETDTQCILITYTGNVASTVKLYTANQSGSLGPYLNLVIEAGSGSSCGSFGTATELFNNTLDALGADHTNFANGLPAAAPWAPASSGATKPYRFTYTLADNNVAQGRSAGIDFVWEAHSS